MSVLIRGAHCPDECRLCKLLDYDRGYRCVITGILVDLRKHGRPEHCPLLSVPEHGRLIDADEFDERIRIAGGLAEEELTDDFKDGVQTTLLMLKTQRTIVPADKEADND